MAASPLLPADTRADALNEVHVAASEPFAVTLEYAHGEVYGDRVLTTWSGLFKGQTFLASGCDISKYKAQVEAAGGRIVKDPSGMVTVLVSEDKSKRSAKHLFALSKKHGKLLPGVYAQYQFASVGTGYTAVKPLIIFVKGAPRYRKLLPFFDIAERVSTECFPVEFAKALRERGVT